ncbi:Alpha-L-fucosidase [Brachybacterium faecium]|uniref:alpha-L-fucosidase n=1 Tax=Brachybacterium faecium (strain ATCC 43885 / DSM 4810 / JCM 11609 / LMG 19847 / NBRC 14762 / NCIMB 9860 / 6-10) TaxID=446465 RepID=C7MHH2_BRAFD|nr:alpha-L-fucosidase [Brachybacterium faecium DSM 4810]SLM96695.1 Alpha-L-fucosidase [Brachybacterium faecium]
MPSPATAPADDVRFGPLVGRRDDEAMRAFRSYGLGQFIHWGLYSMLGNEFEGRSARGHAAASEWIRQWNPRTAPEGWPRQYDALHRSFDPSDFDARRWAREARQMGARYVIFTTKHHDGFAMWPSAHSEYTIAATPYEGDIVGEIVEAYAAEGIDVFLYYSVLEWNHPDYMAHAPRTAQERERWERFLEYTRAQLLELLELYPQVKGLWFDGTWDASWVSSYEFAYALEQELRAAVPGLIIGSRFRADEHGSRHVDSSGALLGDYQQGWERKLPQDITVLDGQDWDCVMTIAPNGWGHIRDTTGLHLKSPQEMIELLMRCRSMNGNLVVNIGPDGEGRLSCHEHEIMTALGEWTEQNAAAVYGAGHVELPEPRAGILTGDGQRVFVTVLAVPVSGAIRLAVPKDSARVPVTARCEAASSPELAVHHRDVGLDRDPMTYYDVDLPAQIPPGRPFVVTVELGEVGGSAQELMAALT